MIRQWLKWGLYVIVALAFVGYFLFKNNILHRENPLAFQKIEKLESKIQLINDVFADEIFSLNFLANLKQMVPDGVFLNSLSVKETAFEMTGHAETKAQMELFLKNVRRNKLFQHAAIKNISEDNAIPPYHFSFVLEANILSQKNNKTILLSDSQKELSALESAYIKLSNTLPDTQHIDAFLASILQDAKIIGLEVVSAQPGQAVSKNDFYELPVQITLTGNYQQCSDFLTMIHDKKYVIQITDWEMTRQLPASTTVLKTDDLPDKLDMTMTAYFYYTA